MKRAFGAILPPACVACHARLPAAEPVAFCPDCYAKLPWWDKTGVLPPQLPAGVSGFAAPFLYEGLLREVILQWKFADHPQYSAALARLMVDRLPKEGLLVPVPLHPKKLRVRTYNHAALLVQALGKMSGLEVDVLSLRKVRDGGFQAAKTRAQRQKLSGADFVALPAVAGEHVILVDDIFTTGATVRACALALRRAGAASVVVRTLCYTAPGRDLSALR
ncbi:MAG TPA: phosphoribosyltransferase family protein [Alphaproteobacteria bacterium]|nr:phosphoribosyltransferase family protein [Alphaproteobacteria bacterium]